MPISPYLARLRRKIGRDPVMQPAVAVLIFDDAGRVLLTRQQDDGLWHTVGGAIDPHEQPAAAALREAREETGLDVALDRVAAVYAGPDQTYTNGDQVWYTTIAFTARILPGQHPRVTDDEGLELRFFDVNDLPALNAWDRRAIEIAATNDPRCAFTL